MSLFRFLLFFLQVLLFYEIFFVSVLRKELWGVLAESRNFATEIFFAKNVETLGDVIYRKNIYK